MHQSLESLNKPFLSLCMIVKNEKDNLPRCLASAKPYVDEIIVVDTGSDDETPEIAAELGAKVSYFEWCDDFAAARNYAISQASGDWILMLDADEELVVKSEYFLDKLNLTTEVVAYCLPLFNLNNEDYNKLTNCDVMRLYRNISSIRYIGSFHEYIEYENSCLNINWASHTDKLNINHYGYSKEQVTQKNIKRNIPMLESIRQEGELSIMLLYCLAEFYKLTQQPEKFKEICAEALERLRPHLKYGNRPEPSSYIPVLIYELGKQSLLKKDYETIQLLCMRGLEWFPNYPPLNILAGATLRSLGFPLGAIAYFQRCIQLGKNGNYYKGVSFSAEYMTTYPAYDMGNVYIDLERPQEALAAFEMVLAFDASFTAAQEKIQIIKQFLYSQI
jgi:glycosyltransferase involved in cell wall biosynthesis